MFAAVRSVALYGVDAHPVRAEVQVGGSQSSFSLVGLPDVAVREAKDRVRAALVSSGFAFPNRRVTVNLSPADIRKQGPAYDLPIALGVLAAAGDLPADAVDVVALGELTLDGRVLPARGALAAGIVAARAGRTCLVAPEDASEAALAPGADVRPVATLVDAIERLLGRPDPYEGPPAADGPAAHRDPAIAMRPAAGHADSADLSEVRGQRMARRALEIAAAGGHHLLLWGPPGVGKSLLARCLPTILPSLAPEETLEVALVWSARGSRRAILDRPPFRAPHHGATLPALIGGGSGVPVPGEVSLAHRGVLFLDELGEFPPQLLDALRQPVEEGAVRISRQGTSARFPASVQLVAATNPCPCGFGEDARRPCRCTPAARARYRRRLSGPFLDRFDLRVPMRSVPHEELRGPPGEPSEPVRLRVEAARARAAARGGLNRDADRARLDAMAWSADAIRRLGEVADEMSARGYDRTRRVAATIADLHAEATGLERGAPTTIEVQHVDEALLYRGLP